MMRRFWGDIKRYAYFCVYSAKSDLKAEVANSYLNWIWWVLEPLLNMLVYYFVFGNLMGSDQEYYIIFIYSALLMWNFFNRCIIYSVKAVRMNREIVTKVYVPKFILLLSNMILNGIKLLISLGILAVLIIAFRVPFTVKMLYVIPIYLIVFIFTFGCGMVFMHFGVFIDDLAYALGILLNMLFFMSGIFYNVETTLASPLGYILARINPMAALINNMRGALIYGITPDFILMFIWLDIGLILSIVGVRIIYKYENSYVKVV